ncbi:hypothetical protein JRI60_06420 [Archangium violaceum]|uniref:hypothetical protein n=1 Tax=Archangium violaceum TaxID=83451 RepID=UPI0019500A4B|nr:hypothetical protein [Archangium violaceum]QRN98677.1 hypothetical protein JRI60_06420 [Archangium violaceum]
MRKTGVKLALLGAVAGAGLLVGCEDYGRSWAQTSQQEDYYPDEKGEGVRLRRGSNTGFPRHIPLTAGDEAASGTGGSGTAREESQAKALPQSELDARVQAGLWQKQDERVPYPPPQFDSLAAIALGTGRPLKAGPNGAWIQGTYATELGSGTLLSSPAPSSGSTQPQAPAEGEQSLPRDTQEGGEGTTHGQKGQPSSSGDPKH